MRVDYLKKSFLETIKIYMDSHTHLLGERPRLQKSALGKIQLYQALRTCLEMKLSSTIFYKTLVCAVSNFLKKEIGSICFMSFVICHISYVICHMSHVTFYVSHVMRQMSPNLS